MAPFREIFTPSALLTEAETCICVVGVGFVGESLLKQFGAVFPCIGYDISERRIQELRPSFQHAYPKVQLTTRKSALSRASHFLISVPTTLNPDRSVNLDHVVAAIGTILEHFRPGKR